MTLLVNAALSLRWCALYSMALSVMPCDAAWHALCGAQGCTRVTEVMVCVVLVGVLEDAESGLWGGELSRTGGVGPRRAVCARRGTT